LKDIHHIMHQRCFYTEVDTTLRSKEVLLSYSLSKE